MPFQISDCSAEQTTNRGKARAKYIDQDECILTIYMLICDLLRQHSERTDLRRVKIDISLSAVSLLVSVRFYF